MFGNRNFASNRIFTLIAGTIEKNRALLRVVIFPSNEPLEGWTTNHARWTLGLLCLGLTGSKAILFKKSIPSEKLLEFYHCKLLVPLKNLKKVESINFFVSMANWNVLNPTVSNATFLFRNSSSHFLVLSFCLKIIFVSDLYISYNPTLWSYNFNWTLFVN